MDGADYSKHDLTYDFPNFLNVVPVKIDHYSDFDDEIKDLSEPKEFFNLTNCVLDVPTNSPQEPQNDFVSYADTTSQALLEGAQEATQDEEVDVVKPPKEQSTELVSASACNGDTTMALLKCNQCDYSTRQDCYLRKHVRGHTLETSFACELCGSSFKQRYGLTRHMRIHTREDPFKCAECDYSCKQVDALKRHARVHVVEAPPLKRPADRKVYFELKEESCERDEPEDMHNHTGEKPCNLEFTLTSGLNDVKLLSKVPLKCLDCSYTTRHVKNLETHMESHQADKSYNCDECSYSSKKLSHLKLHMKKHSGDMSYRCDMCDYATARKTNFEVHLRNHTGEKPYKCAVCRFSSKQMVHLRRHMKTHSHGGRFACSKCDYVSSEADELILHTKTHNTMNFTEDSQSQNTTTETEDEGAFEAPPDESSCSVDMQFSDDQEDKRYRCGDCSYVTNQSGNLNRHRKMHNRGAPHECSVCSYSSQNASDLKRHMNQVHVNEKPHKCGECEYRTRHKRQMDVHMRIHTGKDLNECDVCDYKTVSRYNLVRHKKTHTRSKVDVLPAESSSGSASMDNSFDEARTGNTNGKGSYSNVSMKQEK